MKNTILLYAGFFFIVLSIPSLALGFALAAEFNVVTLFLLPAVLCLLAGSYLINRAERAGV